MIHTYTRTQTVQAIQFNGENIPEIIKLIGLKNIKLEYGKLSIDDLDGNIIEIKPDYYIVKDAKGNVNVYTKSYFEESFKFIN